MPISATYDPADDKIRMRSTERLDAETYARVKAAGFGWAPKQACFFAVWNPKREDLARELAGGLEDEDTTLVERAEVRAERFEQYHEKRAEESERTAEAVSSIADAIPLGQPILAGHHSEKHARRDAKRIENGMRKAVDLWKTAEYWERRARGVLSHAEYKERPEVRARRIKTLEADARRFARTKAQAEGFAQLWQKATTVEQARAIANHDHDFEVWRSFDHGGTVEQARARRLPALAAVIAGADRWLAHLTNRLSYERALLAASGYTPPQKPAGKAALPLLNIRGKVTYRDLYGSEKTPECQAVEMTKAAFAAIPDDCKGTRISADGTHRLRYTCRVNGEYCRAIVFLTDSKEHARPGQDEAAARASVEQEEKRQEIEARRERQVTKRRAPKASPPPAVAAVQNALKAGGVQVTVAPQLFPTPRELARRMAYLADKCGLAGKRVLEPSAGTGNLVRAIIDSATGANNVQIVAVEIAAPCILKLWEQRQHTVGANETDFRIEQGDFLQYSPNDTGERWGLGCFHAILMNPPFNHGVDIAHIKHALQFLKPSGKLVAICANGPRQQAELKPLATTWEELPDDTFAASGTHVRTVLLTIDKGK